jgi:hypothetical protein
MAKTTAAPYWEDLNDKDKIERMRGVVEMNWQRIQLLESQAIRLFYHSHMEGQIIIPPVSATSPFPAPIPPYPADPFYKKP